MLRGQLAEALSRGCLLPAYHRPLADVLDGVVVQVGDACDLCIGHVASASERRVQSAEAEE